MLPEKPPPGLAPEVPARLGIGGGADLRVELGHAAPPVEQVQLVHERASYRPSGRTVGPACRVFTTRLRPSRVSRSGCARGLLDQVGGLPAHGLFPRLGAVPPRALAIAPRASPRHSTGSPPSGSPSSRSGPIPHEGGRTPKDQVQDLAKLGAHSVPNPRDFPVKAGEPSSAPRCPTPIRCERG